jgi:hypothetical protein
VDLELLGSIVVLGFVAVIGFWLILMPDGRRSTRGRPRTVLGIDASARPVGWRG